MYRRCYSDPCKTQWSVMRLWKPLSHPSFSYGQSAQKMVPAHLHICSILVCCHVGRIMCYDLPYIPRTLTLLTVKTCSLQTFLPLSSLLFVAFQYPQLNLSHLLKSSWVRTGMFNLRNVWRTRQHGVREGMWGLMCPSCFPNSGQDVL